MSYLVMYSRVKIYTSKGIVAIGGKGSLNGKVVDLPGVQSVRIKKSVVMMGDSCFLECAKNHYLNGTRTTILDLIAKGDKVEIELAYNEVYNLEFSGYINVINVSERVEIELADEFYPLRRNNYTRSYKAVTLKQLLSDIAPGYKIVCPDINMGKFLIDKASTFQTLQSINEKYGFFSYIRDGVLYCQFAYDIRGTASIEHTYYLCDDRTGKTVKRMGNVRTNDLKYNRIDSLDIRVEVYSSPANGKKIKAVAGSKIKDANIHKLSLPGAPSLKDAQTIADKIYSSLVFEGYRGTITGYGYPPTQPGDALNLVDYDFPERNGKYLIEAIEVSYNENGFSRENTLSYKI